MRIIEKILIVFLPTFMLSVATMTLLSRGAVERILVQDVARGGRALSVNLGQSREVVRGFQIGDERLLLAPLQQVQSTTDAEYALILGPDRRVLAHTNVVEKGKIYDDAVSHAAINAEGAVDTEVVLDGRRVMDIAFPVWELEATEGGEEFLLLGHPDIRARRRLGTIRIGLPMSQALDTAHRISNQVLWIVAIVNVLVMGVSLFYVRKILRPVRLMAAATERVASGELGETVPVLSRDEVGEMAHSFNRMSQELAATTVSADFLDSILDNMGDVLVVTNADGSIRRVNRAALDLMDYDEGDLIGRVASHLFAEDADNPFSPDHLIELSKRGGMETMETALASKDGHSIPVLVNVASFHDRTSTPAGFIVTAADIADRKRSEEQIWRSLREKEILLKEIHHRVKNNLQIISSLLNLQTAHVEDRHVLELFEESQNRVKAMGLIHEKLYRSEDLARLDFRDYIHSLAMALYQSYLGQQQHITIDVDVGQEILLGIDQAIPCGLIINELVSNALKHAFGARDEGRVSVRFELLGKHSHRLVVTDDGSGLPEGIDMATTESLGLKLVSVLVGQLRGEVTIERQGGTRFQIDFGAGSLAAGVDARAETDA